MSVKQHYDEHLGSFYSWMVGDFENKQLEFQNFLETQAILPGSTRVALDLGCGHGIQSVSLAKLGFKVKAIDFNKQLLTELQRNRKDLDISVTEDDILNVRRFVSEKPELIVCWGDTLTHLENLVQIDQFIADCANTLNEKGTLILSFRDYSKPLTGNERFIPVKSDDTRILTCCLDYEDERVRVTDILYEKQASGWQQKLSSYYKTRISLSHIEQVLRRHNFSIRFSDGLFRMHVLIAQKN